MKRGKVDLFGMRPMGGRVPAEQTDNGGSVGKHKGRCAVDPQMTGKMMRAPRVPCNLQDVLFSWPGWLSRMHNAKLIRSMSRKGYSPVNAAFEGFFGRLKTDLFYPANWQGSTIEQFIEVVDSYIR